MGAMAIRAIMKESRANYDADAELAKVRQQRLALKIQGDEFSDADLLFTAFAIEEVT